MVKAHTGSGYIYARKFDLSLSASRRRARPTPTGDARQRQAYAQSSVSNRILVFLPLSGVAFPQLQRTEFATQFFGIVVGMDDGLDTQSPSI
jgi:hypothetical protein